MKISYKHLVKDLKSKPNINRISKALFHLGHEHNIEGEIFDLELTPNRGDCLSVNGIVRDLSIFYETNSIKKIYEKNIPELDIKFKSNVGNVCTSISFLNIEIDSIPKTYVKEIEDYFGDLEIKKNNFFTDISNYVAYETGQPTHCYDSNSIQKGLELKFLHEAQHFKTITNKVINLKEGELVFINNKNEVINLAGVVGGQNSACNKNTKSVIVECAHFKPEAVIGKTIKYGITSEAAHKFERGVDPCCHDYVLRRFIKIVEKHTKIKKIELFSKSNLNPKNTVLDFDIDKINSILGTNINAKTCEDYLKNFGFYFDKKLIYAPSHRSDINNINDIAEEVARAIGYDNINSKKFTLDSKNKTNSSVKDCNTAKIRNLLVNSGFSEVINDPFSNQYSNIAIEVDNPLDSNRNFLRTSLKQSLIDNLLYNERRQKDSIKLFEISDIYTLSFKFNKRCIGIIVTGRVDHNYRDFNKKLDKKYLTNILKNHIDEKNLKFESIERNLLKSKSKNTITYLEITIDESLSVNYETEIIKPVISTMYSPISDYPSSTRDLSLSITDFSKLDLVQDRILSFQDSLLKNIFIFDYFHNKEKAEIKIGFRFVFQSNTSTITEEEVNSILNSIIFNVDSIDGVCIPGIK